MASGKSGAVHWQAERGDEFTTAHDAEDAPRRRLSGLESELTVGMSASTISATRMRTIRENDMSFRRGIAAAVVAATGIVCTVQTAVADESGTFTVI